MARTARASLGGICYHVINRGNCKARVFFRESDYDAFLRLISESCDRLPMRILAYCLMPNHFHLVLWPYGDGDLGRWMHWLLTSHVRRYHGFYGSTGRLWQGRYKAFPIHQDDHLFKVLRYVERNPLRANLVPEAMQWPWSSLGHWSRRMGPFFLEPGPVSRPLDWNSFVNTVQTEAELEALQLSVNREMPFGPDDWKKECAVRLGLESSLRSRGRPIKKFKKTESAFPFLLKESPLEFLRFPQK